MSSSYLVSRGGGPGPPGVPMPLSGAMTSFMVDAAPAPEWGASHLLSSHAGGYVKENVVFSDSCKPRRDRPVLLWPWVKQGGQLLAFGGGGSLDCANRVLEKRDGGVMSSQGHAFFVQRTSHKSNSMIVPPGCEGCEDGSLRI